MSAVFADTFFFLALWNAKDAAHARAVALSGTLQGVLVTTAWVLTELGDAMSAPANRLEFIAILNDLSESPHVKIIPPDAALFDEGIQFYARRPDKEWSLTDCISFVVMTKEGITDALTGDHHFEQAGFVALLK
jgi:predicted nucleic acid-binding protein